MPTEQEIQLRQQAEESLIRMQQFDPKSLSREDELGRDLSFRDVIPAAERLIRLYNQLSLPVLDDLPQRHITVLTTQAGADFNRFNGILKFAVTPGDPLGARNNLIRQVQNAYEEAFDVLHPLVSYSTSKAADFKRLEKEARASMQAVADETSHLTAELQASKEAAEQILHDIRAVAAEHGVSQQAIFFQNAAQDHEKQSSFWHRSTLGWALALAAYAVLTLFLYRIPVLAPDNLYETVQLGISKVLIFGILSYMLYLAAKNYLAHKHNSVINKHRQNALMTYTALVDAAKDSPNKEVILTHASACIFSPQPTGYSSAQSSEGPVAKSVVELLTSTIMKE